MTSHASTRNRVGIVGAGIAGSSAAYFVRQELGAQAEILVFERAAHVGGRVQERQIAGTMMELGGSIFHSSNRYLVLFVEVLGLHQQPSDATETFGIWNGTSFDLKSSPSALLTQLKILLRYGLTPLRLQRLVKEMVKRLTDLNAFVNLVSLAGAGMAGGYLCSVHEGNSQVCQGLLRVSGAKVRTDCRVQHIARFSEADDASWALLLDGGETERFDAVITATPLEGAEITISESTLPETARLRRTYQTTHVTLVVGQVNPVYFGGKTREEIPDFILTREDPTIPFSSLEIVGNKGHPAQTIYKLFSREPATDGSLSALFVERKQVERWQWQAYPVLSPMSPWPPFQLSKGLYYVNAMESAVSTMETEVIASRNVVNLLKRER
jgi:prenylcysteine oxidase/farnesylcysteine lyase